MSGELALRLIRSIRTGTESTVINDLLQNNPNQHSIGTTMPVNSTHSKNGTNAEEIDIVPYKCICPYSNHSPDRNSNQSKNLLKKFTKFVQNIPCDRPCAVNLYRHLRNYHKVDLQHAKDITRTIMLTKTVKNDGSVQESITKTADSFKKRVRHQLSKF